MNRAVVTALVIAAALVGYAARPPIAALLAGRDRPPASEGVALIADVTSLSDEPAVVDLAPLMARCGDLRFSVAVEGDPQFPIAISSDGERLELSPGTDRIGIYDATLTGTGGGALVTDRFRIFVNPHAVADIPPVIMDTALLDLPVRTLQLSALAPAIWGDRAMAVLGDDMLIADSRDQFFRLDLDGDPVAMTQIAVPISTNGDALRDFVPGLVHGVAIQDILFFDGGRRVAVSYSHWDAANRCVTLRVDAADVPDDWGALGGADWVRLFESRPCLPVGAGDADFFGHLAGGRMIEDDPGTLLLTVGSFGFDMYPQDPDADYGKVLAIGTTCCDRRLVSLGHRNAQGLTRDKEGALWMTEQGPRGGDELNLVVPGRDYGWPAVTYGVDYDVKSYGGQPVAGHHDGYEKPVYAWVPSIAAGNILQVHGFSKEWEGDFLVNSLKAQDLRRLRIEDGRVIYDEPIHFGVRLRDSGQLADGRIVILSDDSRLFILSPTAFPDGATDVASEIAKLSADARAQVAQCRECHTIAPGVADSADRINLAGIFGRDIASAPAFRYSSALETREGVWDARSLGAFLRAPQGFAPGTTMAFGGIGDEPVRDEIVRFLERLQRAGTDSGGAVPPG